MRFEEKIRAFSQEEVWNEYCSRLGVPEDGEWLGEVKKYEENVLKERV